MFHFKSAHLNVGRWLMSLLVGAAGLALPGAGVRAAPTGQGQPGLALVARAGFGDDEHYVINEWFPVRVSLANPPGAPSIRVRVEVDARGNGSEPLGTYARELDLPSQSRKEVTLYTYATGYVGVLDVRVVQGDTVIKTERVTPTGLEKSDTILGVVSSDASLLNVMRGEKVGHLTTPFTGGGYYSGPGSTSGGVGVTVAHLTLEDIPPLSPALNSLGALVMEDVDTGSLSQEQVASVRAWVARGGILILASRPGGAPVTPAFADLLPVVESGTRPLSGLDGLSLLVMTALVSADSVMATAATLRTEPEVGARQLAAQDGAPIIASRKLGEGQVVWMGVSPALPPLKSWDGTVPLFKRLLAEYRSGPQFGTMGGTFGYYPGYGSGYGWGSVFESYGDIFDLPGLDLPSPLLMAAFLLVYIVIVGPVNFMILRRRGRPELAWLTIPVLVALFSIGAYVLGRQAKGGEIVTIRADIIQSAPGVQEAQAMQVYGVFSPLRDSYKVSVGAESVVSEMERFNYGGGVQNPARVVGGSTTTLDNVRVTTGGLKGFVALNTVKSEPALEADLRLADNRIVGTVRNRTRGGLQDVALVRGSQTQHIGYMAPGGSAQVDLPVTSAVFNNNSPTSLLPTPPGVSAPSAGNYGYYGSQISNEQREYNRKIHLLNMALTPLVENEEWTDMDVRALAWDTDLPVDVKVEGQTTLNHEVSLWTGRLAVKAGQEGNEQLDRRRVPYWTYTPANDPAWSSSVPDQVNLAPHADFIYSLPAGTRPQKLSVEFEIAWSGQAPSPADVLAYNVQSGEWDHVTPVDQNPAGAVGNVALTDPARYVGPAGDVTLRLVAMSGVPTFRVGAMDLILNGE